MNAQQVSTPTLTGEQIAKIVSDLFDAKIAPRLNNLELRANVSEQVVQELPAFARQMKQEVMGEITKMLSVLGAGTGAVAPVQPPTLPPPQQLYPSPLANNQGINQQPEQEGAGAIPLGLELTPKPSQQQQQQAQQQQQIPAQGMVQPNQDQELASQIAIYKQMLSPGAGTLGNGTSGVSGLLDGGGGNPITQMIMKTMMQKFMEPKPPQQREPNLLDQLGSLSAVFKELTGFMSGIFESVDSVRGSMLDQKQKEAQIKKIEADSTATIMRAMKPGKAPQEGKI